MNKSLKIFVDAHCFDNEYQGSRTFLKGIYTVLSHYNEVEIFMGAYDTQHLRCEFPDVPGNHFFQYRSQRPLLRLVRDIPGILRQHEFDFAHFQYVSPIVKWCKYIVTTHDLLFIERKKDFPWSYRLPRYPLFKYCCRNADIRTAPSVFSRNSISKYYHIHADKITVIPNGVNTEFFERKISKDQAVEFIWKRYQIKNFILYVSRIEPRKNHASLLQLYMEMQLYKKDISIVFIGKESIKDPALQTIVRNMPENISRYIRHFHQISSGELPWFYRAAKLVVYPSLAEGFGIPPLEAAAMETPVLCSNTTAMADFQFLGDQLFDPGNKQEFQKKLGEMLSRTPEKEHLQELAKTIYQKYSWEKSGSTLLGYMKKALPLNIIT